MKPYPYYNHFPVYTVKQLLLYCREKYASNTAFSFSRRNQNNEISYIQFKSNVDALGTYLFSQGYTGCHIAVFGENSYEWILTGFLPCGIV